MNLTEQVNRGKLKPGLNNKSHKFVHRPFIGFHPKQRVQRNKKDSTPSSKINWGQSYQSITSSLNANTETSSKENARIIIALSEGRGEARCEVGIAVINVSQPHLILCQISDTQSYDNTLRKINIFNPSQILVPMTFVESVTQSRLIEKVKEQFPLVNCTAVKRNTYNKASGMEYVQELCVPSLNSVLLVLQHRYYALTAASALLKFLQNNLNIFYASGSIKIDYQESEGYAIIDICTADRLELVSSTRPFQASKYSTLFGVLNNCYTRIGERALRTILLQPPSATSIILERQDAVTALVNRPEKLQAIQAMLQKIGNIDQLLILPTIVVDDSQYWSERQLNYMLYLNGLADLIMPLNELVLDLKEDIFMNFCNTLKSQDFLKIRDTVRTLIHENAYSAKSQNGLTQRCFAIKPGINGLLDLVRKIYSERLDDMREYVKVLGERYDLPLILGNNISKGYHIVLSLNKHQKMNMKKSDLPKEFIQVCRLAGSFTMKTMEIINFQTRIDDIVADIMKISNVMIFKTLSSFKKYMGIFYKLCEHISNIDVIQSLAAVSIRNDYIKPSFGEYTEVKDSQHPMLEMLANEKPVANLISSCEDFNIHIITGPNGSGKSIFIRQVMLLQIIAQIGGYVPASSAVFRPADRFFARVYLEDNMECGASSFVLEIKEVIYILSHITNNSLVIMDELGRSTSLEEGSALAMTVCERLADSSAFVYLTSHFTLVTKLADLYLNVKNWHMDTEATGNTPRTLKLDFKYTLKKGVTNLKRYGIFMVKTLWPADILEDVYTMLERSSSQQEAQAQKISEAIRLKYKLESNLRKLKAKGKLTLSDVYKLINQYRSELESQNIILGNINLVNSVAHYLPHNNIFPRQNSTNSYLDDSDEMLSEAADSILCSPNISQRNYQLANNETEDSSRSNYKLLSKFIDDDSKNVNLLIPDVHLSFSNSELNHTIDKMNQSLLAAVSNENKTEKINILSNIVLNHHALDNKACDDEDLIENSSHSGRSYLEMKKLIHPSQGISGNSHQSGEMNGINWNLFIENVRFNEKVSSQTEENSLDRNLYSCQFSDFEDNSVNFHSQNQNGELEILDSQNYLFQFKEDSFTNNCNQEVCDFQFLKPSASPLRGRSTNRTKCSEKIRNNESPDIINQFQFSLPLLRNQNRTSTPIRSCEVNFADDSLNDIRCSPYHCPNKNFYKDDGIVQFETKQSLINQFSRDTKENHLFPEIIVIEGPNDRSISFGEEDDKQGKPPFSTVNKANEVGGTDNNVDEKNQNFEEFIKEEVKFFLSQSADLFEGDVDSLEITLENYQKSESSQKNKVDTLNNRKNNEEVIIHERNALHPSDANKYSPNFSEGPANVKVESQTFHCSEHNNFNQIENRYNNLTNNGVKSDLNVFPDSKCIDNRHLKKDIYSNISESHATLLSCPKAPISNKETITITSSDNGIFGNTRHEQKHSDSKQNNHILDYDYCYVDQYINDGSSTKDDSKGSNKKEKVTTTSISEASRLRNLDVSSSDKSSDSKHPSKSSKRRGTTTTDISGASRQRNLDNLSSNIAENISSSPRTIKSSSIELPEIDKELSVGRNEHISYPLNDSKLIVDKKDLVVAPSRARKISSSSSSKYYQTADDMSLSVVSENRNLDYSSANYEIKKKLDVSKRIFSTEDVKNIPEENMTSQNESEDCNTNLGKEKFEHLNEFYFVENSNYRSPNEKKLSRKRLGYTKRSCYGSTSSNKSGANTDSNDGIRTKKIKRIVGPLKLTKNEIQEEFNRQDQILLQGDMDISTYSRYLNQRMNRPSVRQIQNAEHIATIRKTDNGTLVLPAKKRTFKFKKRMERSLIVESTNCFDMSIFSDQNANKMSAFLASSERKYSEFKFEEARDVWSSNPSTGFTSQITRKRKFERTRSLGEFKFHDFTKISQSHSFKLDTELHCSPVLRQTQLSGNSSFYIPDGYFKENKKDIDDICSKYLHKSNFLMRFETSPI